MLFELTFGSSIYRDHFEFKLIKWDNPKNKKCGACNQIVTHNVCTCLVYGVSLASMQNLTPISLQNSILLDDTNNNNKKWE